MKKTATILFLLLALAVGAVADEIHNAAKAGDVAKVRELLTATPALVNARSNDGKTPLHYAAIGGGRAVAELLIHRGANVNALDNERGKLLRRYDQLRNEITTYENNLGFLNAASKKGNSLVEEMNRKVEKLKADLEIIKQKIKAIDAENK